MRPASIAFGLFDGASLAAETGFVGACVSSYPGKSTEVGVSGETGDSSLALMGFHRFVTVCALLAPVPFGYRMGIRYDEGSRRACGGPQRDLI